MRQAKTKKRIAKIERVSITDEAVSRIRSFIETYHKPGDRLPTEMELKDQLGVGRSTVREALRVLQALGMVEIRSGKGAFVREAARPTVANVKNWFVRNETEIGELVEVRMAIEQLAARLAVARGSEKQLRQVSEIQEAFKRALVRGDNVELAMLDESFHNAIIEASNNPLLVRIGKVIADAFMEYRTRSFAVKENIEHAVAPHDAIVGALRARNEVEATEAIRVHLNVSMDDVSRVTQHG